VRYPSGNVNFNGRVAISGTAKLVAGNGNIIFKGFAEIEDHSLLNTYGNTISIGINTYIGPYSLIYGHGNVYIGDNVLISPGVRIFSSNHGIGAETAIRSQADQLRQTIIGNDVWIGANAVILGGTTVGRGAVVGAGSIVTHDIPENAVVVGNPARIIKYRV
jgi:acetyltransferase-like isoleucine patch superfamily enzyme